MADEETTSSDGPTHIHMVFLDGSGNPDDDPDHVRSEDEIFYDEEIAPRLREVTDLCKQRGMSIVAQVEYEPGATGNTRLIQENPGAKLKLTAMASRCNANVDALIMGIYRMMEEEGSLGVSIYMKMIQDWKAEKLRYF